MTIVKIVVATNYVLTVSLSASLNHILSMVETYQLIVLMPLFTVALPANVSIFFGYMMQIAAFEIFDTKGYLDKVFKLNPSEPLNGNFESLGLESIYLVHNMGTLALLYVFYIAIVAWSYFMRLACPAHGNTLQRHLFWGALIRLVTESYSIMSISCLINMRHLDWTSLNLGLMSSLTLLVFLLLILFPVYYTRFTTRNFDSLMEWKIRIQHRNYYEHLELRRGTWVLL